MALQQSLPTSSCSGVNHADFSIDGRYATFTCEFRGGGLVKIDMVDRKVLGYLRLSKHGMSQGIRIAIATKNGRPIRFEIDSRSGTVFQARGADDDDDD